MRRRLTAVSPLCLRCVSAVAALSKTPANRTLALGLVAQRERSQTIWRLKYVNNNSCESSVASVVDDR